MEKLVANLSNQVKNKTLQGRDFLVAPVSMLLPGVFTGSAGPILYEEPDIKASVPAWNAKPITVGHPADSAGEQVSGCTPESLDSQSIGMVLNTRYNSKLRSEAWFDVERLGKVPGGDIIHAALLANQKLEVSTGLYVKPIPGAGTYRGKDYVAKATDYKPDHLAIILNGEGACSLKDGAGLLVNQGKPTKPPRPERDPRLVGNAKSLLDQVEKVRAAVYAAHEVYVEDGPSTYCYIEEIYSGSVVFEKRFDGVGQYFKQNYEITDGEVTLVGELMPVVKTVSYQVQNKKQEKMERKDLIAKIGDSHSEFVTNLSDDQFKAIEKAIVPVTQPALVVNTLDKLLALADAGLANQVKDAMTAAETSRAELIDTIVTNSKSQFTKEELASFSTVHLSKMAKAIVPVQAPEAPAKPAVYAGAAFVGNQKQEPVVETGFAPPSTY